MLNDRRNCFLGRGIEVTERFTWTLMGDPPPRGKALTFAKSCRGLGGPFIELSKGFRSCGGDALKHSSSDEMDMLVASPLPPAPNLNAGNWLSTL